MAPPSPLAIATSSVQRLVNEEASYHKELKQQEGRLERLLTNKDEDENAEYQLKQEASLRFLYYTTSLPAGFSYSFLDFRRKTDHIACVILCSTLEIS